MLSTAKSVLVLFVFSNVFWSLGFSEMTNDWFSFKGIFHSDLQISIRVVIKMAIKAYMTMRGNKVIFPVLIIIFFRQINIVLSCTSLNISSLVFVWCKHIFAEEFALQTCPPWLDLTFVWFMLIQSWNLSISFVFGWGREEGGEAQWALMWHFVKMCLSFFDAALWLRVPH